MRAFAATPFAVAALLIATVSCHKADPDRRVAPTRPTALTAAYCDTPEATARFGNLKGCAMKACDGGDQPSCEIARQFATAQAPPEKLEGMDYMAARRVVTEMGWKPVQGRCDGLYGDEDTCRRFPEIGNCSGTGLGYCDMTFERRGRCLTLVTIGGPPDGVEDGEPAVNAVQFSRAPCRSDPDQPA